MVGKHAAVLGAAVLMLLMSGSTGRVTEIGGRLTVQVLRHAIGASVAGLRRSAHAQARASRAEQSDAVESARTTGNSGASAVFAALLTRQSLAAPGFRLLCPNAPRPIEPLKQLASADIARARAPPAARARDPYPTQLS